MTLICISHSHDYLGPYALRTLSRFGCKMVLLEGFAVRVHAPAMDSIALFTSLGQYPNKHLRIMVPEDVERRGFSCESWADNIVWGRRIALRMGINLRSDEERRRLDTALEELYWHFSALDGYPRPRRRRNREIARREKFLDRTTFALS